MSQKKSLALGQFKLIQPLLGITSFLFMCLNVLIWAGALHLLALLRLVQTRGGQDETERLYDVCYSGWIRTNEWWFQHVLGVHWQLDNSMTPDFENWHLMIANHRSWADVYIILAQLNGRRPLPRIFMKEILFWIPLVGTATWLMHFPMMKRYSKEILRKHPHLAGKDLETTRQSCARFIQHPNSVLNFVEGTRFSQRKHDLQSSPYNHLLKPKAGGIAFVLQAMQGKFTSITDLTVLYGQANISFWDLLCGRLTSAKIVVREVPLPQTMLAETYQPAETDREDFFAWFNLYWHDKDSRMKSQLDAIHSQITSPQGALKEGNSSPKQPR